MKDLKFNLKDKEVETNFEIVKGAVESGETEDARLESTKLDASTDGWNIPTLINNWVNYGSGFSEAGYRKDSDGYIHFRGLIKNGTVGANAFVLPAGYRSTEKLVLGTISNSATGRITILPAGGVYVESPSSNIWVSLDGLIFKAEQ